MHPRPITSITPHHSHNQLLGKNWQTTTTDWDWQLTMTVTDEHWLVLTGQQHWVEPLLTHTSRNSESYSLIIYTFSAATKPRFTPKLIHREVWVKRGSKPFFHDPSHTRLFRQHPLKNLIPQGQYFLLRLMNNYHNKFMMDIKTTLS